MAVATRTETKTPVAPEIRLPQGKSEAQNLLRRFGYTGLKIDKIEQPVPVNEHVAVGRIYALTGKQLQADRKMRRKAVTVVFRFTDEDVTTEALDGWVVT